MATDIKNLHHSSLAAWTANTAYTVGQRVGNGGNAYQCTTSGTSAASGGPTTISNSITDNTVVWKFLSAIDFTSLSSFVTYLSTTYSAGLTNPVELHIWNDAEYVITTTLTIPALTGAAAGNSVLITAAPGESFKDNVNVQTNALRYNASNGVAIRQTATSAIFIINLNDMQFVGLQLRVASSGSTISGQAHTDVVIDSCINVSANSNDNAGVISINGSGAVIKNSLIVNEHSAGGGGISISSGASAYNCTIVRPSDLTPSGFGILNVYSPNEIVENCLVYGFVTAVKATSIATISTCQTDVASPPTGFTQKTYANQFQNTLDATQDFRLKVGAPAIDAGTAVSSQSLFDIVGTRRDVQGSAYDVGAWEFVQNSAQISRLLTWIVA